MSTMQIQAIPRHPLRYITVRYGTTNLCPLAASWEPLKASVPRIPLVRQRPAFLRSRHLSKSDAATAVKGAKRDRSHAQPQASMARTSPLTAGGRGVVTLFVGCGTYVRGACAGPLTCFSWCEDLMTGPAMRQGTGFTPACKISPAIACILLRDQPRQNRNIKECT